MAFFRSPGGGDNTSKTKVETFIMSDGAFCINDPNLVKVISSGKCLPEHEAEFSEHLTEFVDVAAAQFFVQHPDL